MGKVVSGTLPRISDGDFPLLLHQKCAFIFFGGGESGRQRGKEKRDGEGRVEMACINMGRDEEFDSRRNVDGEF